MYPFFKCSSGSPRRLRSCKFLGTTLPALQIWTESSVVRRRSHERPPTVRVNTRAWSRRRGTLSAVDDQRHPVVVSAGSLRSAAGHTFLHRWTPEGVTVETDFTGAHLLHLAAAGCVLNDVYREAVGLGIALNGVLVRAAGGFDTTTWHSTGIDYTVELDSPASDDELSRLLEAVDTVAEIPRAIRAGAPVRRVQGGPDQP